MQSKTQLLLHKNGDKNELRAPEVGLFTCALAPGSLVGPGQVAGVILTLGKPTTLVVPDGVSGRITSPLRDRVQAPVGYGETLYELAPVGESEAGESAGEQAQQDSGLILRSSQAGRFYHRAAPDDAAYVEVGGELQEGQVVGLVEIMKTFSQVQYSAQGGLPARARVVRFIAGDGVEVRQGDALIEVEPA